MRRRPQRATQAKTLLHYTTLFRSYPCSPKTSQEKQVPLGEYGINDDIILMPDELTDNVYCDSVPKKDPNLIIVKDTSNIETQTTPLAKIDAFKQHLLEPKKSRKKDKKIFDSNNRPGPLERIDELPEEYAKKDDSLPLGHPIKNQIKGVVPLFDNNEIADPNIVIINDQSKSLKQLKGTDKNRLGGKPNTTRLDSPPQSSIEINPTELTKPLNPF